MIPKGNQRGGGQQLATHLMNAEQNELVEIHDVRGTIATDLHGAFKEWRATADGTKCKKYIYSLSINPDHRQGDLTRNQYLEYIEATEKKLGLKDQPRAIVFHVKAGREHCHVAWSRIDTEKMKAVNISNDRRKLRSLTQDFAKRHGLQLPEGMKRDRGKDRFKYQRDKENLHEKQQEERTGISLKDRMKAITQAWNTSDSGKSFIRALSDAGYYLAKGDKKAYVVVDRAEEVHALPRQIPGVKLKDIETRLKNYPLESLPSVERAQKHARSQNDIYVKENFQYEADERRGKLHIRQQERRSLLKHRVKALKERHQKERQKLKDFYDAERRAAKEGLQGKSLKGLAKYLARLPGISFIRKHRAKAKQIKRVGLHRKDLDTLKRTQSTQKKDLDRQLKAMKRVEKRETRTLETRLKRELIEAQLKSREYVIEKPAQRTQEQPEPPGLTEDERFKEKLERRREARRRKDQSKEKDNDKGRQR